MDGIACLSNGQAVLVQFPKEKTMSDESITDHLRRIEQKLDEVLKFARAQPTATVEYKQKTADDADLDGKYGDPEVRFTSKFWQGRDYTGYKFSDTSPEFLDQHARYLDARSQQQAGDPEKAKYAGWSAKDAARARGWAARLRARAQSVAVDDWDNDAKEVVGGDVSQDGFPF